MQSSSKLAYPPTASTAAPVEDNPSSFAQKIACLFAEVLKKPS